MSRFGEKHSEVYLQVEQLEKDQALWVPFMSPTTLSHFFKGATPRRFRTFNWRDRTCIVRVE